MSEITTRIPCDFIQLRSSLSWREVQFGLERRLIGASVAIAHAANQLSDLPQADPVQIQLAASSESDPILHLVVHLAARESRADEESIAAKWLYLVLAWVYENRHSLSDPLAVVEQVYSDFGYPREIAHFKRYMPMLGDDLGSREQNEARLVLSWEGYLESAAARFGQARKSPDGWPGK